jgi:hypothetical protein
MPQVVQVRPSLLPNLDLRACHGVPRSGSVRCRCCLVARIRWRARKFVSRTRSQFRVSRASSSIDTVCYEVVRDESSATLKAEGRRFDPGPLTISLVPRVQGRGLVERRRFLSVYDV